MRALIFDLDGTLVDTVYAHVLAWQLTLAEAGMPLDGWRIHRRIGMSGGLFTRALAREVGPQGVYVNAIAPSMIRGETTAKMDPAFLEGLRQRYPLRKLGELRDIQASAIFLASSDSDFYTGQMLCPAGGEVMV